ncbi:uncharacterized protein [Rutidosis leptorrhynchoides]|uniref:uncharacterized protein n=1 Tax=Rutidosis leptorrhynchoides TaxID=125765 RepID=UPI003A98D255
MWSLATNGMLTVKKLAVIVDEQLLGQFSLQHQYMQNKLVPKKIEIFVWRTMLKRLPVRVELDKRGIYLHSIRCPLCDDDIESVDHIFLSCKHAVDIWIRVYKWWNLCSFTCNNFCNLLKDVGAVANSQLGKRIFQATIWVGAYMIWKARNYKVFQGKNWSSPVALNEIQIKSFEWISSLVKDNPCDDGGYPRWFLELVVDPNYCLFSYVYVIF